MRNSKRFLLLPALAVLVLVLMWMQPPAAAQQQSDPAAPPAMQPEAQPLPDNNMSQQSDMKIFTGKIMKSGNQLVLKNNATTSIYKFDDQDRAKVFEGKNVKVKGTLDEATGTIHIASIELEPET